MGKLAGVPGVAFATEHGAVLALEDPEFNASLEAAKTLSSTLKQVDFMLLRRGPSEDPVDSDVQAMRFKSGDAGEKLAPGLVMSGLSSDCERLILGTGQVDEIEKTYDTASLSKFAAMRALATAAKKPKS